MLDSQERMGKKILKPATLKSSDHLNMQQLREEHDKGLNDAKENGTTENIEELDKLCKTLEGKIQFLLLIYLVILALYRHI